MNTHNATARDLYFIDFGVAIGIYINETKIQWQNWTELLFDWYDGELLITNMYMTTG